MAFCPIKSWVFGFKHHYLSQIFDWRPSGADWAWLYHLDWRGSNQLTFTVRIPVFDIFLGFFGLDALKYWYYQCLKAWKPLQSKKVQKCHFEIFWLFLTFFFFFSKMAVDRVKMIFQTPNKGGTCFKHYKFLNFDEKQVPQKFGSTHLQISLVPCS